MITQHLAPESARELRLKLYNDPVFLIAHEAVRPKLRHIDPVALFVSAQNFAAYLVQHGITDHDLMRYELDDVRCEMKANADYYIFLTIVFIKLCSVAKRNPMADQAARAIVGYCNEYDGLAICLRRWTIGSISYVGKTGLQGCSRRNYAP